MKMFLLFAMVIIFISVFFTLSISTKLIEKYIDCLEYQNVDYCSFEGLGVGFAEGMFIIACFVLIDIGVITLLIKHYLGRSEPIEWEA
jgi:hypothetical protein